MARVFFVALFFGFFLGYVVRGEAAETGNPRRAVSRSTMPPPPSPKAYRLSLATGYGPSSLAEERAPAMETRGNFRQILAMVNRAAPRWEFALGFGLFASDLSGTAPAPAGAGLGLTAYSREIAGEVARAGARYRFTDRLEGGLSADLLFGTDVSFAPNVFAAKSSTAWLAGTELLYGIDLLGMRLKLGARYFASLGLAGRRLDGIQGVLEAGVPVF